MGSPVLEQLIAIHLLAARDEILPHRRADLLANRDALVTGLAAEFPEWRFTVPVGGLCLWVELDAPMATMLSRAAGELGLRVAAGPRFGPDGTFERYLRLPFVRPPAQLADAVARLAQARRHLERPWSRRWSEPAVVA
jgi:DNA-binding transcriptional MocR family regulator